ncbi:hypothetical protein M758_7G031200 [Ceratodon purpureus]|nr:hypothetical protein M758_7G031200 [Ceratodon purpureus]
MTQKFVSSVANASFNKCTAQAPAFRCDTLSNSTTLQHHRSPISQCGCLSRKPRVTRTSDYRCSRIHVIGNRFASLTKGNWDPITTRMMLEVRVDRVAKENSSLQVGRVYIERIVLQCDGIKVISQQYTRR